MEKVFRRLEPFSWQIKIQKKLNKLKGATSKRTRGKGDMAGRDALRHLSSSGNLLGNEMIPSRSQPFGWNLGFNRLMSGCI